MEETTERKRGNPAGAILLCVVIVFVLYILSPVPVAYVLNHSGYQNNTPPIVINIYSPFAWVAEHTRLKKPIERYGDFLNRI